MKHLDSFGEWRTSASRRAEDVDDREIVINRVRDEWNQRETFHADEESCSFLQYHLYVFVFLFSPFCRYCAYLRSARALHTEKLCTCICVLNDSRGCIVEEHSASPLFAEAF